MACPLANQAGGRRRRASKRVSRKGRKSTTRKGSKSARRSKRVGRKVRKTRRRRHRGGQSVDTEQLQKMMGSLMKK